MNQRGEPRWLKALASTAVTVASAIADLLNGANAKRWVKPVAIGVIAFFNGAAEPTFGSQLPHLQADLEISAGQVGLLITGFPIGLIAGGIAGTVFGDRIGSRRLLLMSGLLFWGPLIAIAGVLASGFPPAVKEGCIAALWTCAGAGNGGMDVGQGAEASAFGPSGKGLRTMLFQATQSFGTLVGAVSGALAFSAGVAVSGHFLVVGAVALVLGVPAALVLPRVSTHGPEEEPAGSLQDQTSLVGVGRLFALGAVGAASVVPLGLALNWAVSVGVELRAPRELAGVAVVAFAAAALVGQLIVARLSEGTSRNPRGARPERLAFRGALIASAGVILLVAVVLRMPHPIRAGYIPPGWMLPSTAVAFLLLGFGTAPVPGMAQQAAYNVRVRPVRDITFGPKRRQGVVTVIQYAVMSAAPALVGWLADASGWGILASLTAVVAVSIGFVLAFHRLLRHARLGFGGIHGRYFFYIPYHSDRTPETMRRTPLNRRRPAQRDRGGPRHRAGRRRRSGR
jgi:MFS family permease